MRYEIIIQLDDVDIDVIGTWNPEDIGCIEISELLIAGIDVSHLLDERYQEIEKLTLTQLQS
jgi:hypothetical protein